VDLGGSEVVVDEIEVLVDNEGLRSLVEELELVVVFLDESKDIGLLYYSYHDQKIDIFVEFEDLELGVEVGDESLVVDDHVVNQSNAVVVAVVVVAVVVVVVAHDDHVVQLEEVAEFENNLGVDLDDFVEEQVELDVLEDEDIVVVG
jgi:hypothetical protein